MKDVNSLLIAVVQDDIIWGKRDENFSHFERVLKKIPREVMLTALPETFSTGFMAFPNEIPEEEESIVLSWLQEQTSRFGFAIATTAIVNRGGNLFNRFFFVEPNGNYTVYDKRHLFTLSVEKDLLTEGTERVVIDYLGWKIFPQICYDLRFPVWQRNVWNDETGYEYDLMLLCANWPASRITAWNILLQGRAVENQCYVAAVNRVGKDGQKTEHNGHSKILDFKGNVLAHSENGREILIAVLQQKDLKKFRDKFPFGADSDRFILY
ncbi:MAG: nitrilase family protein [Bacteroidales bacterium]|nr:nitrilase family protein [Bacteroidales bacterium]